MLRQLWVFLAPEDETTLLQRLGAAGSIQIVRGRFFKGTDEDLRRDPSGLASRELREADHRTLIVPTSFRAELVVHDVSEGPYAGWRRIDEVRSEVLILDRKDGDGAGLAPSRLAGAAHAWVHGDRVRKSAEFTRWLGAAMRLVESAYAPTQFDWLRVAPGAADWARAGGRLHYLFRPVGLDGKQQPASRPHGRTSG